MLRAMLALSLLATLAPSLVAQVTRATNEMGRIPVLEYHLIGERESRWSRN